MNIRELNLSGIFEITYYPHFDNRGFFMRTYDSEFFKQRGIHQNWLHENHSRSEKKGIIRGLHFQIPPYEETKFIRCIKGTVFDVVVDLRRDSPTFAQWTGVILSEEKMNALYISRGFAHGFCTLTEISEVIYKVDNIYSQEHERGIIWNDKDLKITWPISDGVIISEKDSRNMTLEAFLKNTE